MSETQAWKIDEKGRWHMSDQKKIYLVVLPGEFLAFTDEDVAFQVAAQKKGSVVSLDLNPPQPRTWYVEVFFIEGTTFNLTANPGSPPHHNYNTIKPLKAAGIWYCYVLAVSGSEAKEKVKEILIEMVKKANT